MEITTIKEFKYKVFDCIIKRVGFRNRSTDLREAMELTGPNDFSMRQWWLCGYVVDVHEGLTFSDNGERNTWIIGFDCNHAKDGDNENTEEFVVSEIQKLVDQLTDPENDLRGLLDDMENGVII